MHPVYLIQLNKLNDIPTKGKTQGYIHSAQQFAQTETKMT